VWSKISERSDWRDYSAGEIDPDNAKPNGGASPHDAEPQVTPGVTLSSRFQSLAVVDD
jgi:hypothetical protein